MKRHVISFLLLTFISLTGCINSTNSSNTDSISEEKEPSSKEATAQLVEEIKTNVDSLKIILGKKAQLLAEGLPVNATDNELVYSIPIGEDVISIDENGLVTTLKTGYAEIVIKVKTSNVSKKIPVNVVQNNYHIEEACPISNSSFTYHEFSSIVAPSVGKQKILVIPTSLSDCIDNARNKNLNIVEKAYKNIDPDDGWFSLKEYYDLASYGKLDYDITVTDKWFYAPSKYTSSWVKQNYTQELVPLALQWFKNNYPEVDLDEYDTDNDGIIDNIHLIHNSDEMVSGLWAYTTVTFDGINTDGKKVNQYMSAPLALLTKVGDSSVPEDGINASVIIHENGHLLGLVDYYDEYMSGMDLVGYYDMQSVGYLDWNAFSKYSAGWISPRYVDEDCFKENKSFEVLLSSSSIDGDALIIRNKDYIGNAFDEYIMIELFNSDASINYYDTHFSRLDGIDKIGCGVKIYHVDARLWQSYYDEELGESIVELVNKGNITRFPIEQRRLINDNNAHSRKKIEGSMWEMVGDNDGINYSLLHLLQKGGENTFGKESINTRKYLNNSDLWQSGDTFTIGEHEGYQDYGKNFFYKTDKLNDGTTFPYGLTFDEVSPNTAIITINYLK